MNITVITVGKLKEQYLRDMVKDFSKEISKYHKFKMLNVMDEKCAESLSDAQMRNVKDIEGEKILKLINKEMYVITLEIKGKKINTKELNILLKSKSDKEVCFVIGGSLGLSEKVSKRSNYKLSFSDMTFPHQLMLVILLEQIKGFCN